MRVIAGSSRGRKLPARLPSGVRPTQDRVREAIFDILGSLGGVAGADVLDLFCGSGALGVEALSRGAGAVTFVDRDRAALRAVRANLAGTGLAERTWMAVHAELPGWLGHADHVDVALCDPPYAFAGWRELLEVLPAELAVLESSAEVEPGDGWVVARSRHYGGTLVTVVLPTSPHRRRHAGDSTAPGARR